MAKELVNLFATLTRFRYIGGPFSYILLTVTGVKKNVHYI